MRTPLLILLSLFMASCSTTEKQLKKAIERHGAKESALLIVRLHPEYFKSDSVKIDTTLNVPVETTTPEIKHDSTFPTDINKPNDPCPREPFEYKTHDLKFRVEWNGVNSKVSYTIAPQIVRDTVKVPFKVTEPCPPCPEVTLIEEMNKELLKKEAELAEAKSWPKWVWFCIVFTFSAIAGGLVYGYMKIKPL